MALGTVRLTRLIVAVALILASCLLTALPHGHLLTASDAPSVSRENSHAPHADPCLEPGIAPHSHDFCAVCCFQRLLSGGQIATFACRAPVFFASRMPAPPREIARSVRAGLAVPRGPPTA